MKNVLAFAGSNSSTSINHSLLSGILKQFGYANVELIRLTDYPLPMFSEDREENEGYPDTLKRLLDKIKESDGLIISVNEHNGTVSAYFKNVLDWLSRLEYKFLEGKKVLLLSTSNGKRGAQSALDYTVSVLPRFNGEVVDKQAVPRYSEVFDVTSATVKDEGLRQKLGESFTTFFKALE